MTNEEIIEGLKFTMDMCLFNPVDGSKRPVSMLNDMDKITYNACEGAIKLLESQPCEDAISRTELLRRIDAERNHLLDVKMDGAEHIIVHHARRIIEDMPSVTPKAERSDKE